jgi:hypothetical protein
MREDREEHIVCGRSYCSFGGGPRWRLGVQGVRLEPPLDRIQRIMDCRVHHGKDPRFMERVHTPIRIVQARSEGGAGGGLVPIKDSISPGKPGPTYDEK